MNKATYHLADSDTPGGKKFVVWETRPGREHVIAVHHSYNEDNARVICTALNVLSQFAGTGLELVARERARQIEVEGWTAEHDDQHTQGELSLAAACYAMYSAYRLTISRLLRATIFNVIPRLWPFDADWLKPDFDSETRDAERAAALLIADIDRVLRAAGDTSWSTWLETLNGDRT